jgi:hypothetical protein
MFSSTSIWRSLDQNFRKAEEVAHTVTVRHVLSRVEESPQAGPVSRGCDRPSNGELEVWLELWRASGLPTSEVTRNLYTLFVVLIIAAFI